MSVKRKLQMPDLPQWVLWLLSGLLVVGLVAVMAKVWPIGADYYYHRQPVAESFLAGETRLYDGLGPGFRTAPWALLIVVPLSLLPPNVGQAVLNVASLVGLVAALHALRPEKRLPLHILLMSLGNLYTFDLLIRGGKFDALVLVGLALGWWAIGARRPVWLSLAFWLMAIKPVNIILVALLYLWAIRNWPLAQLAQAVSLPLLSVVGAGFVVGFDWPVRYFTGQPGALPNQHLSISLWRVVSQLGLPGWPLALLTVLGVAALAVLVWRVGLNRWSLGVALATNMVFTPYANDSHLVLLIPAFLFIASHDWKLAALAYLTTWTPLLRLAWGYGAAPIDMLYPALLLAAAWAIGLRTLARSQQAAVLPTEILSPAG